MTLMAGPIDTRVNPTKVNELANSKPIDWFEQNLIARVPFRYAGAFRQVYPGFVQLAAFMSMNIERHIKAHQGALRQPPARRAGEGQDHQGFLRRIFRRARSHAPSSIWRPCSGCSRSTGCRTGTLEWRGEKVEPRAIRRTALLTVEGERDDICAVGQTLAAHDLCSSLRPYRKRHHMQAGVGHYGVFSGKRWEQPDLSAGEERHPVERIGLPGASTLFASHSYIGNPGGVSLCSNSTLKISRSKNPSPSPWRRATANCSTPIPMP